MPKTDGQRAGGRRGPSIRRPLYLLVAIPLLTVIGLYAFVLYTTVGDAINLDRAPNLINATSVPAAQFDINIQNERKASLVYLAAPTATNRAQLAAAQNATTQAFPAFQAKMTSSATTGSATTAEEDVIRQMLGSIQGLGNIRPAILARAITPTEVFGAFSNILTQELQLFIKENASLTNAPAATQSLAIINSTESGELLSQEDALVTASLAAQQLTAPTRIQVTQLAGGRQAMYQAAISRLDAGDLVVFNAQMNKYAPANVQAAMTQLEDAVAADTTPFPPRTVTTAVWNPAVKAMSTGIFFAGVNTVEYQVQQDHSITNAAWRRVALSGGLGLLGLLLSMILSALIARWLIRRIGGLEESAVTLAGVELPSVVARLRRGEDVPVEELSGTDSQFGRDEIGRVGQAFDAARRTAIEAAVGEARMRRGINDVFRNLARRNQSLLHRELTVLDGMERRTTDPETLEDLFRLDHLTTRMRRHSEGLIILSGAAPGRGWVHPVRMIDVLRAAAAEVEDYSRVTVTTPSQAALTGPAVADVIHLLAELIENATTLSPPYTPVRVSGDMVASGFAVEIEDRGLGMSEQRFVELNARLAEPPEFDVFNSEQLGLFVVGQLAKRHGIRVTLRPSPYGGTTAIALIPTTLVGVEDGFVEGLPSGMSAISSAWAAGRNEMPSEDTGVQPSAQAQLTGPSWGALPQGNGSSGANGTGGEDPFGSFGSDPSQLSDPYAGRPYAGQAGAGFATNGGNGSAEASATGSSYGEQPFGTDPYTGQAYGWTSPPAGPSFGLPGETGGAPTETGLPWPYDRPAPAGHGMSQPPAAAFGSGDPAYQTGNTYRPYSPADSAFPPAGDPFPLPEAPPPPAEPSDPTTQPSYSEAESTAPQQAFGQDAADFPPGDAPYPSAETAFPGAEPSFPATGSFGSDEPATAQPDETYKGLPKRVRQANLAPQLRDRATPSSTASAASGDNVANRSPDDIRNALSAMQRGWQHGRAGEQGGSADDATPGSDAPASGANEATRAIPLGPGPASPDDGTLADEEGLAGEDERPAARSNGNSGDSDAGHDPDSHGDTGGYGYGSNEAGYNYGTADNYGVGNVGYPGYSTEPAGSTGSGDDAGRSAEPEASGSEEQSYRGGNDDL
ncbi:MAG: nitrate- and nitrite sensing domain-containing protein [Streptosporangiaceae bacterium]